MNFKFYRTCDSPLTRHAAVSGLEVRGEVLWTGSDAPQREVSDGDGAARPAGTVRVGVRQHVHSAADGAVVFVDTPSILYRPSQSCPWVWLTHGLSWVGNVSRIFVFK